MLHNVKWKVTTTIWQETLFLSGIFWWNMRARGKKKRIYQNSTSRKVNGTTISLASISKSKFCFLPKHLPLFYKRSIKTPIWNWRGRYFDLQPCFKSWKLVGLWRNMRRRSLSTLSLVCLRTLKCIGLTFVVGLWLNSCMPKWLTKFWGLFLLLIMWL